MSVTFSAAQSLADVPAGMSYDSFCRIVAFVVLIPLGSHSDLSAFLPAH